MTMPTRWAKSPANRAASTTKNNPPATRSARWNRRGEYARCPAQAGLHAHQNRTGQQTRQKVVLQKLLEVNALQCPPLAGGGNHSFPVKGAYNGQVHPASKRNGFNQSLLAHSPAKQAVHSPRETRLMRRRPSVAVQEHQIVGVYLLYFFLSEYLSLLGVALGGDTALF